MKFNFVSISFYLILIALTACSGGSTKDETPSTLQKENPPPSQSSPPIHSSSIKGFSFIQNARWFFNGDSIKDYFTRHPQDEKKFHIGEKINIRQSKNETDQSHYAIFADFSHREKTDIQNLSLLLENKIEGESITKIDWKLKEEPTMAPILADYSEEGDYWLLGLGASPILRNILSLNKMPQFTLILSVETNTQSYNIYLNVEYYEPLLDPKVELLLSEISLNAEQLATGQYPTEGIEVFKTKIQNPYQDPLYFKLTFQEPFLLNTVLKHIHFQSFPNKPPEPLPDDFYLSQTPYEISHYQILHYAGQDNYLEEMKPFIGEKNPLIKIAANETIEIKWFLKYIESQKQFKKEPFQNIKYNWLQKRGPHICLLNKAGMQVEHGDRYTLGNEFCFEGPIDESLTITHSIEHPTGYLFESAWFEQKPLNLEIRSFRSLGHHQASRTRIIPLELFNGSAPLYKDFPNLKKSNLNMGRFTP